MTTARALADIARDIEANAKRNWQLIAEFDGLAQQLGEEPWSLFYKRNTERE